MRTPALEGWALLTLQETSPPLLRRCVSICVWGECVPVIGKDGRGEGEEEREGGIGREGGEIS